MEISRKEHFKELITQMSRGAYEREEVIALSLLSAIAGESIFLLGLPGVGKSMVARRLKDAFKDSRCFEYLMSRFSTPDEIFGPVSISKLKDEDTYERNIDGYLPTADVAFLDEIWKAGPAIQNSLLTALNEKIFHNGQIDIDLPLKGIIAASNELPAEDEGLEALWDRFLIRYIVQPIAEKDAFYALLSGSGDGYDGIHPGIGHLQYVYRHLGWYCCQLFCRHQYDTSLLRIRVTVLFHRILYLVLHHQIGCVCLYHLFHCRLFWLQRERGSFRGR